MGYLNDLRDKIHGNAKAKGFHDEPRRFGEDIALIMSELAEAFEDYRNGNDIAKVWYEDPKQPGVRFTKMYADDDLERARPRKPCGIPSELADVIIRVLDSAGLHNADIGSAVDEKMAYNAARPQKHGGKKV